MVVCGSLDGWPGPRNGVNTREGLSPLSLSRDCCSPAHMDLLGHRVGAERVLER